jgi:crotonobetainyl-CoA:carnitine CoA-transferase CaiB-like acyl-CoA transferase
MDKLGVGYENLASANPALIYCSVTGFGQTGLHRDRPAFDQIIQARSGLMSLGGWPGGPPQRAATAALDYLGPFVSAASVLAALHYRHRTGKGQRIDLAMNDIGGLLTYSAWPAYFVQGIALERYGNRYPLAVPYNAYQARDGLMVIGVTSDEQWDGLLRAMGEHGASLKGRYEAVADRLAASEEIDAVVAAWVVTQDVQGAVAACLEYGAPAGPVLEVAEVLEDPHLAHREMLVTLTHPKAGPITVMGSPVKLSETPSRTRGPAPDIGQHTAAILAARLNYRAAEVAQLREEGVI